MWWWWILVQKGEVNVIACSFRLLDSWTWTQKLHSKGRSAGQNYSSASTTRTISMIIIIITTTMMAMKTCSDDGSEGQEGFTLDFYWYCYYYYITISIVCIYTYISLLVLFYFVFIIIIPCYYYEFYIFYLRQLWKITFTTKKVAMLTNAEIIFVLNDAATFIWCNNGTCYSIKVRNIGTIALYWSRIENEMLWMQTRQVKISLVCTSHTEDRTEVKWIAIIKAFILWVAYVYCAQATMWQTTLFNLVVFDFVLPAVTSLRGSIYYFLVCVVCTLLCAFSPLFSSQHQTQCNNNE